MDETSIRLLISSLETQLDSLDFWLYLWTVFVIVGCAGELFFVIHEHFHNKEVWEKVRTRGLPFLPEKPSLLFLLLEFTSVALVVVGISGELYIDKQSGNTQTHLRNANSQLLILLEREAGSARGSAEAASRASGTAIAIEQELRADLKRTISDAEAANRRLEEEQRQTADAQTGAARAQLDLKQYLDKVAKRQQGRNLNAKTFVNLLEGKPRASVQIWYEPNDSEAYRFAREIQASLGAPVEKSGAGWAVSAPVPIPEAGWGLMSNEFKSFNASDNRPVDIRYMNAFGPTVLVLSSDLAEDVWWGLDGASTAAGALAYALMSSSDTRGTMGSPYPNLKKGEVIVVVAQAR